MLWSIPSIFLLFTSTTVCIDTLNDSPQGITIYFRHRARLKRDKQKLPLNISRFLETLFSNINLHFFCIISLKRPTEVNLNAWQLNHLAVGLFEYHFWLKHLWKWNIVLKKTAKIDLIISRLLWEFTCMSSRENFSPNKKAEVKAGFFAHCLFQKKNDGDGICLPKSKQTYRLRNDRFYYFP